MTIELIRIEQPDSTMIKSHSYNYATQKLTVIFNTNSKYIFDDVPLDVYNQLRVAASAGKAFNALIKNQYNYVKVQEANAAAVQ